jgi:hypothetical protein
MQRTSSGPEFLISPFQMGLDFPQGTYHISPSRKRRECLGWAERVQVVGLSRERERERERRGGRFGPMLVWYRGRKRLLGFWPARDFRNSNFISKECARVAKNKFHRDNHKENTSLISSTSMCSNDNDSGCTFIHSRKKYTSPPTYEGCNTSAPNL